MLTIFDLIENKTETWIKEQREDNQSAIGNIIKYIEKQGKLREPQLKSIETYLWLKFVGQNKELSEIIRSGLLFNPNKVAEYQYNQVFGDNYTLQFLNAFAQDNELKNLQKELLNDPKGLIHNWNEVLNELLHNFDYPNYLFSLPMGAGKTYLMASFIYLDLYFARVNLNDKRFAHNFVVFAPHAAKTAILPSLQTIKDFRAEWILPPNESKVLKQIIHIEILDSLSSKRKDKLHGNNPNLEKVNRLTQINNFGLVFITNAEKVVLERYNEKDLVFLKTGQLKIGQEIVEEIKKTNELREKLSQIPNLSVILDEVHHAYEGSGQGEKKLRQSVSILNQHKNVVSVLGLSGTPFVKTKVKIGNEEIRLSQIQDIVYNYSLADGIGKFLKKPEVTKVEGVREGKFISDSLNEFFANYDITYSNGTKSKVAFYCPSKKVLHEEILPVINDWYRNNRSGKQNEIFKFYTADKEYPLPKESKAIFHNLDKPYSDKRVILLVAIGTEGWDCRSLTGVVLPRNETTKNFVLQTTCRCLREVDVAKNEKAMIFLGEGNYETLNRQLKENYQLTIDDLKGKNENELPVVVRKPQIGRLKFKQVKKHFRIEIKKETTDFKKQLQEYKIEKFKTTNLYSARKIKGEIGKTGLSGISEDIVVYSTMTYSFDNFLYDLSKQLYGRFSETYLLLEYSRELKAIHRQIVENNEWISNHPDIETIDLVKDIAACFAMEVITTSYIVEDDTTIELLEWTLPANIYYGSGVTPKIANDLGKKFVACDIGVNAIQTTRDRLVKAKAEFDILKINDGVRLFRNPAQTVAKLFSLLDGYKDRTELGLGEFWDGGMINKRGTFTPVKFIGIDKKLTKELVDVIIEEVIGLEEINQEDIKTISGIENKIPDVKIIYAYKQQEVNQDYVNKTIRLTKKSGIKAGLVSLDELLSQKADVLYTPDNAVIEIKQDGKLYIVEIKKYFSSYLKNKIDDFNNKKVKPKQKTLDENGENEDGNEEEKPNSKPKIQISESGLELIEAIQFDTALREDGVWTSNPDLEDKAGVKEKIKAVYKLTTDKFKMKIRNISGDEIIIDSSEIKK